MLESVLPTSLSEVRNSRLAGLSAGNWNCPTAVREVAPRSTTTPLSSVSRYAPGLADSRLWSSTLA